MASSTLSFSAPSSLAEDSNQNSNLVFVLAVCAAAMLVVVLAILTYWCFFKSTRFSCLAIRKVKTYSEVIPENATISSVVYKDLSPQKLQSPHSSPQNNFIYSPDLLKYDYSQNYNQNIQPIARSAELNISLTDINVNSETSNNPEGIQSTISPASLISPSISDLSERFTEIRQELDSFAQKHLNNSKRASKQRNSFVYSSVRNSRRSLDTWTLDGIPVAVDNKSLIGETQYPSTSRADSSPALTNTRGTLSTQKWRRSSRSLDLERGFGTVPRKLDDDSLVMRNTAVKFLVKSWSLRRKRLDNIDEERPSILSFPSLEYRENDTTHSLSFTSSITHRASTLTDEQNYSTLKREPKSTSSSLTSPSYDDPAPNLTATRNKGRYSDGLGLSEESDARELFEKAIQLLTRKK
ncbi:hypothetical protein HK096_002181 [Nowakowskiella sp. JEL0078]|nr:hypothetical protein HK096_002181 [Nowakowskiella sp. JEL0078]